MRIFLDTANIDEIKKWHETGILDGVTTNPTHLSKEGGDPTKVIQEICKILPEGQISVEVTEKNPEKVYAQAKKIAKIAKNIVVKIPCHLDYYEVIKKLAQEDEIPLNITLVFSVLQGLAMCKLGVEYISPFIGRLDDVGENGIELVEKLHDVISQWGYETKIIAASVRDIKTFEMAVLSGTDVVTVPPSVLEQALKHKLTDAGMEKFLSDWNKLNIKDFPK